MASVFPEPIRALPEADIPIQGIRAWLSRSVDHQVIFMEFAEDVDLPEHAHAAQVGFVLEGRIDLTIGGETRTYTRGDRYHVPAGVPHSGRIHAGYADITFFDEADRYVSKKPAA